MVQIRKKAEIKEKLCFHYSQMRTKRWDNFRIENSVHKKAVNSIVYFALQLQGL